MKNEVKKILINKGRIDVFSEGRFELVKAAMRHGMKNDAWLKNYLSLDVMNRAQWCADHLVIWVGEGKI